VTTGIASDLWLFRRASIRIASQRVAANKAMADCITAEHTARRVRDQLERDATRQITQLREKVARQIAEAPRDPELGDLRLCCSTTRGSIVFAMLARPWSGREAGHALTTVSTCAEQEGHAKPDEPPPARFVTPPAWSGQNNDLEVFVHRGVVIRFVREKKFQRSLEMLAAHWTTGSPGQTAPAAQGASHPIATPANVGNSALEWLRNVKMSADGPWYRLVWNADGQGPALQPRPAPVEPPARSWIVRGY
jgi:hypothetical protein